MDVDRSHSAEALVARRAAQARIALAACPFSITELSPAPEIAAGELVGYEQSGDVVTSVGIVHRSRPPGRPWVAVETSRWAGTVVSSAPLRTALEDHMREHGDRFSAVPWTGETASVLLVDGHPVTARRVGAGRRWWALRGARGDDEITVVARDWHPAEVSVRTVADLASMPAWRGGPLPAPPAASEPIPPGSSREPHRALVDAALQADRERGDWQADGGPAPRLPRHWGELWRAAVRRQMALADQSEAVAEPAVRETVSHLSALQQAADWFGAGGRLRERAIAETLLWGTGLDDRVASRAAQLAWARRREAARDQEWISEWAAWAARHA